MLEVLDRFDRLTSCGRREEERKKREKAAKRFEAADLELDDQAKEGFAKLKALLEKKRAAEATDANGTADTDEMQ